MEFSFIIATYERCESLHRLLTGIATGFGGSEIDHEVIVANNARDHNIAKRMDEIINAFRCDYGKRFRSVREPNPGKCKAQNLAIRDAEGAVLAFFDDDVEVIPEWITVAAEFFRSGTIDVMQGPIMIPPQMQSNEELMRLQRRYRTINFVQYPSAMTEIKTLTGANIAVRREVFLKIGYFNEELGPGRSGISEDVEFAQRVIRSGGRIGYEHRAAVYHEVDWSRLTERFFRLRHEQQGRSRLIYKKQSLVSIVPNLMRSVGSLAWHSLLENERKKYRAKGRYFHYRAMLSQKFLFWNKA